ncbi:MAG: hypothetical protein COB07_05780 [Sulfurovum sp.]|nr:MAG: hypothetical protein COB07_05780 [Sulfurovum sp.]
MFKTKSVQTRSYVYIFSIFTGMLFLYHLFVYSFFSSKIIAVKPPMYVGDLARLSYQIDSIKLKKSENTLPRQHLEGAEYKGQKIDVLTIGDSFSNGGGGGKNGFYQDYIASINDFNVLNIRRFSFTGNSVSKTFFALYNSGLLNEISPRIVLLSIGSRDMVPRFGIELDWEFSPDSQTILEEMKEMKPQDLATHQLKDIPIVNAANFKLPYYTLFYRFMPCLKQVCKLPLEASLFTVRADKEILVYRKSLKDLWMNTPENVASVNANLNRIARLLELKGIKLYFMPAVTKYDLYSDFIKNNPYPKDPLFDLLEPLKKEYTLINTKEILLPLLREGEKDVYHADDTHWSSKASEEIFMRTAF